ncbi:MAG: glucan 1,4-alpha-glucosidase [bacterium]
MIMRKSNYLQISVIIFCFIFLGVLDIFAAMAPGGPGADPIWNYAGKLGIGTSYEKYYKVNNKYEYNDSGQTGRISKVWFSISKGIITETAYQRIDKAQIKDLQFLIVGNDFFHEEKKDTNAKIEYLYTDSDGRPLSLAYKVINTAENNKYKIEKYIFTDPDRQSLFMRVKFIANDNNITPYILINPHMNNTGSGDYAFVESDGLYAYEGNTYLCLKSSANFSKTSAGFVGASDGWNDLNDNNTMDWEYGAADHGGGGNVAMMAKLETINNNQTKIFDIAVGFGNSKENARQEAEGSLNDGYDTLLKRYNGEGSAIGWEDYISSLSKLSSMVHFTGDKGKELYASAMVLKAQEDKQFPGALIASLSIPWGDTVSAKESATGYRAVWPRDFYQCASALLALGDQETPLVSFQYLEEIQVKENTPKNNGTGGWFLQKTHVDGTLEWVGVQLDQTAMPIMLGWKLWDAKVLSDDEVKEWYYKMLKPAANFLKEGGYVNIDWNKKQIAPPKTQQERWEEQEGYSPSTIAAVVTGLVCAAHIAEHAGETADKDGYLAKADEFEKKIESTMFASSGEYGNGKYFLRITPDDNPNNGNGLSDGNGALNNENEKKIMDAGFLELVRYGLRKADNSYILDSITELDDTSINDKYRIKYDFQFENKQYPGWRRYGCDGYGERTDKGSNFTGYNQSNRGRVWPFFTGERGHYELEMLKLEKGDNLAEKDIEELRDIYVKAMEYFANEGLMIPEQVWDGIGTNSQGFVKGEGTNSATPLAWSHAEYVKLVRSLHDRNTWDSNPEVRKRYGSSVSSIYEKVYFRGTLNEWKKAEMELVTDYTWEITATFGEAIDEGFKFDIYPGDWSLNFGDNNQDGIADQDGENISITEGAGEYIITFNDNTKEYTITKRVVLPYKFTYSKVYFRGTSNVWGKIPMELIKDYTWEITAPFVGASNEGFKFDIYPGDWSLNFGDKNQDGIADQDGENISITEGAGEYIITFNDSSKEYTITKEDTSNPIFRFFKAIWNSLFG